MTEEEKDIQLALGTIQEVSLCGPYFRPDGVMIHVAATKLVVVKND